MLVGMEARSELEFELTEIKTTMRIGLTEEQSRSMSALYLQAVDLLVLRPVTMFLTHRISAVARQWFDQPHQAGALAPHGLWVLDPANWANGARRGQSFSDPTFEDDMIRAWRSLVDALGTPHYFTADGRLPTGSVDGLAVRDGATVSTLGMAGYFGLGLQVKGLDRAETIAAPGGSAGDFDAESTATLPKALPDILIQQLLDDTAQRPPKKSKPGQPFDPLAVHTLRNILIGAKTGGAQVSVPSPRLIARRAAAQGAETESALSDAEQRDGTSNRSLTRRILLHSPALRGLFRLFDHGFFSIGHILGEAENTYDVEPPPYDVVVTWLAESPPNVRLTLPDRTHLGVHVSFTAQPTNYRFLDAVVWRYFPPFQPLDDEEMNATLRAMRPDIDKKRVVIVAAPGVTIDIQEWPYQYATLDIIRVQNIDHMPAMGEAFDPDALQQVESVTITDMLEPDDLADLPVSDDAKTLISRALEPFPNPDPDQASTAVACGMVMIRPLRDTTAVTPKTGIQMTYVTPHTNFSKVIIAALAVGASLLDRIEQLFGGAPDLPPSNQPFWPEEDPRPFAGAPGQANVTILLPEGSGSERFAYWFEPFEFVVPDLGNPLQFFHMIRYRLVIHATPGVEIKIEDTWNLTTFDYVIYRTKSGKIMDVPPQGSPLAYGDVDGGSPSRKPVKPYWFHYDLDGSMVRAESSRKLDYDNAPLQAAQDEMTLRWLEFAADMVIGMIPIVGDLTDAAELVVSCFTGVNKWGQPMTNADRVMLVAGAVVPFVGGKAFSRMADAIDSDLVTRSVDPALAGRI